VYASYITPSKGMCDVSRDLFKFWETSDNISLTVQDRAIVATEQEIVCGLSNGTIINALE